MNNYLIIGDSQVDILKKVLEDFPDFHCFGFSDDLNKSLNTILKGEIDLVFLDIDTKKHNPFSFINGLSPYLSNNTLACIAISSTKEKAYESIKSGFFDYLLNPLTELEIRKAILNFDKKRPPKEKKTLCLRSYKDYQYLHTQEIMYLKADNNTTDFYMDNGNVIGAFKTLKTFEKALPKNFLRIHKSYIVNKNHITRVNYRKLKLTIKTPNHFIPFTKTYLNTVEKMINTLSPSA